MSARLLLTSRLPDLARDDRALLDRFIERRDDGAFAALVRRHGPMVLGVCRRAVHDLHLAEDAFQAVFVVLARNPASAARSASVGGWLFGVARRVGLAARRHEKRRLNRERAARTVAGVRDPGPVPRPAAEFDEILQVLDAELAAMPDEYRAPLIACYLREQTQDEAARQLGWSVATLRRRLDRGKALLRARLSRRGAALSAGLLATALSPSCAPAVPPPLAAKVLNLATGEAAASPVVCQLAATAAGKMIGMKMLAAVAVVFLGGLAAMASGAVSAGEPERGSASAAPQAALKIDMPLRVAAPVPKTEWVTLKGQMVFPKNREIPKPRLVPEGGIKDKDYCLSMGPLYYEDLVIDPKSRGIRNVVVWLRPDAKDRKAPFPKDRIHPKLASAPSKLHTITIACCQFEPHVIAARAGDTIAFHNASKIVHNAKYNATAAGQNFNVLLPQDQTYTAREPLTAATLPVSYECNIHPWMRGYVWTFDHPYSAVTDADGRFTIPKAPVGTWRLVIWHEDVGFRNYKVKPLGQLVTITDRDDSLDLGTVAFDADWDDVKRP